MAEATVTQPSKSDLPADPVQWALIVLRGAGQIMFQDNAATGLLFLVGIGIASPLMSAGGLVGAILGTLAAVLFRCNGKEIADGLFGFNATLVGIAVLFFHPLTALSAVLLVVGCIVSTPVTWLMRRCPFPTYTAPFIVTTWVVLWIAKQLALPVPEAAPTVYHPLNFFAAVLEGLAEVMFQANVYTGLFFLAAIAVSSWRHAALAFLGAVIGSLIGLYHNDPASSISIGIYGYNASLAAISVYLWRKSLLLPILGAIASTVITEFFPLVGIPALTAPFVLASWLVIAVGRLEPLFCTD